MRRAALAIMMAGCAIARRSLVDLDDPTQTTLVVMSAGFGAPADLIFRHAWIAAIYPEDHSQPRRDHTKVKPLDDDDDESDLRHAVHRGGRCGGDRDCLLERSRMWELDGDGSGPIERRYMHDPIVHGVWRGAVADAAVACLDRESTRFSLAHDHDSIRGSNNNAYVEELLVACGLHASLPANALAKDIHGWASAGITSEGTGVQLDIATFGVKLGLKEGIEVHVLGMAFGIDLWPPALIVPFGPGRIGFADR